MGEVFGKVRVGHHGVLGVAEHVGLPVGRDRAELDCQRILLLGVVLQSVIIAARSVKELPVTMSSKFRRSPGLKGQFSSDIALQNDNTYYGL